MLPFVRVLVSETLASGSRRLRGIMLIFVGVLVFDFDLLDSRN